MTDIKQESIDKMLAALVKNEEVGLTSPDTILSFFWDEAIKYEQEHGDAARQVEVLKPMVTSYGDELELFRENLEAIEGLLLNRSKNGLLTGLESEILRLTTITAKKVYKK